MHGHHLLRHDVPHTELFQEGGQLILSHMRCIRGHSKSHIAVRDDPNEDALVRDDWEVTNPRAAQSS